MALLTASMHLTCVRIRFCIHFLINVEGWVSPTMDTISMNVLLPCCLASYCRLRQANVYIAETRMRFHASPSSRRIAEARASVQRLHQVAWLGRK